jgi:ABC-2 type transport system ATP-binding protein
MESSSIATDSFKAPLTGTIAAGRPAIPQTVLQLENAAKRYGSVTALHDTNLTIRQGEVVALLGPNGAGKTTCISLLLGLTRPTRGSARLFGSDPQQTGNRMRVGTMMQISGIPDTLTVREHLEVFASYYPRPLAVSEAIRLAGLDGLGKRPSGKLSGGQKQRLHLAIALIGDPEILFLDEPTTGLDVKSRRGLWQQVRSFIAAGRTVVLTTHYLEEADALADRIVLLDQGRIIREGTPAEIKASTAGMRIRANTAYPLEAARQLPHVMSARHDGTVLELLVSRPEAAVRELLAGDRDLTGLEVTGVGLEEAFLALTGQDGAGKGTRKMINSQEVTA